MAAALAVAALGGACTSGPGGSDGSGGGGNDLVRDADRLTSALEEIGDAVGGETVRVRDVIVYPDYAIVEAQDPEATDHIDRYMWRDGDVGESEPVHLSGPQEEVDLELFPMSAVRWADVEGLVSEAEDRLETAEPIPVEEPQAGYVAVSRSGVDDRPLVISVYVTGPRRSGYVEFSPQGDVVSTNVS